MNKPIQNPTFESFRKLETETKNIANSNYQSYDPAVDRFSDISLAISSIIKVNDLNSDYQFHMSRVTIGDKSFLVTQYPYKQGASCIWKVCSAFKSTIFDLVQEAEQDLAPYYPTERFKIRLFNDLKMKYTAHVNNFLEIPGCTKYEYQIIHYKSSEKMHKSLVTRIHYSAWRDKNIVAIETLAKLAEHLRSLRTDECEPIVHCRAGVGRTGTLVTAAYILDLIEANKITLENMYQMINELILNERKQTSVHFVQTYGQYQLLTDFCISSLKNRT